MSDEQELRDALAYVFEIADRYDIELGEYDSATDYAQQIKEYRCFGCNGVGYSRWPEWKAAFTHEPNCRYIKARELAQSILTR